MNSDEMNFNVDPRKPALSMGNSAMKTAVNALAESYDNACREMAQILERNKYPKIHRKCSKQGHDCLLSKFLLQYMGRSNWEARIKQVNVNGLLLLGKCAQKTAYTLTTDWSRL